MRNNNLDGVMGLSVTAEPVAQLALEGPQHQELGLSQAHHPDDGAIHPKYPLAVWTAQRFRMLVRLMWREPDREWNAMSGFDVIKPQELDWL
jgi:hypothetical protein